MIEIREWSNGGMIMRWESGSTRRKIYSSDTFSATYPTATGVELVTFRISFYSL
jgi:hypothetical protein